MSNQRESNQTQEAPVFKDRRRKADWVSNMASLLSFISWAVAFAVWVLLEMASPEKENIFTRMFSVSIRRYWDSSLLQMAFGFLLTSLITCIIAFFFNMLRKRRKSDKYKKSIIVIGLITFLGIIIFFIRFSDYII